MLDFSQLQQTVFRLYEQKQYAEILELTQQHLPYFQTEEHRLRFWGAAMLSLLGQPSEALDWLRQGLKKGLWWNPSQFKTDPDFANLLGQPSFAEILEQCQIALEMARVESQPKLRVYPSSKTLPPLLLALHMRGSNAEATALHWEAATRHGWMVAVPQSSQVYSMNGFCWDNFSQTEQELQGVFTLLSTQSPYNRQQVVYGGASQGGLRAVQLSLKHGALGFVAIVPSFGKTNDIDLEALLPQATQNRVRGVVISGQNDWALQATQSAVEQMQQAGLEVQLEIVPDLPHDYPQDLPLRLARALEWIKTP